MAYDNRNRGTIAKNTRKTEDNHPDIAGQINVDGRDFWLNGWLKTNSKDGSKFYSLTVKPKQDRNTHPSQTRRQADDGEQSFGRMPSPDSLTDEIPFAPEFR